MLKAYLIDLATGKVIHTEPYWKGGEERRLIITSSRAQQDGVFKSITVNNTTSTLVTPLTDGAISLTDLIISSEKQTGGIVTVQFFDGTNTVLIASAEADSPIGFASNFAGRWNGWKDAYIQVDVSAAFNATVSIGYFKLQPEETLGFAAWDALR